MKLLSFSLLPASSESLKKCFPSNIILRIWAFQHNFQEMKQLDSTGLVELLPKIHEKERKGIFT
jgi:hypothetical protein